MLFFIHRNKNAKKLKLIIIINPIKNLNPQTSINFYLFVYEWGLSKYLDR